MDDQIVKFVGFWPIVHSLVTWIGAGLLTSGVMTCNISQKQYVGKSLPKFRLRYNNYKTKFRKYYKAAGDGTLHKIKPPLPQAHLYQHFFEHIGDNFIKNGKEDWSFWSFQIIDKSFNPEKLLERENIWIYKLKTMVPAGLNVREVPIEN